jgi:hypothetical protein
MNRLDTTAGIPEFGADQGVYREPRIATTVVALVCVLTLVYGAFPAVAAIVNTLAIIAAIAAALALTVTGILLSARGGAR